VHENSMRLMRSILAPYYLARPDKEITVLDYGSMEHAAGPGTYRPLMPANWKYYGCDLEAGPNVDVVMAEEYNTGFKNAVADIVISGQCLEHVRNPFKAVAEMARVLKPGGIIVLIAPFAIGVHRFPIDCWRFAPDGFEQLMEDAGIRPVICDISEGDCYGVGVKA
jgi:SAM-dependent methyltransferase